MQAWFVRSVLVAAAAAPAILACSASPVDQTPLSLAAAEARWQAMGVHSYQYTLTFSCFCGYAHRPVRAQVRNDSLVSLVYVDDGSTVNPASVGGYDTIRHAFATLKQALAEHPVRFDATYDAVYGFPRDVFIDHSAGIADDELRFAIDSFAVSLVFPALVASR